MTITRIAHGVATHGNTLTLDTTGANLLVTWMCCFTTLDTMNENKSNGAATTLASQTAAGDPIGRLSYWLGSLNVGTSHVFQASSTNTYGLYVAAYSGVQAYDSNVVGAAATTGGTTAGPGTIDAPNNNSLFIYGCAENAGTAPTSDTSFATLDNAALSGGVIYGSGFFERIEIGDAGSLTPTASWTTSAAHRIASMATFSPSVGGGVTYPQLERFGHRGAFRGMLHASPYPVRRSKGGVLYRDVNLARAA